MNHASEAATDPLAELGPTPLPTASQEAIDALIVGVAVRSERAIALARVLLVGVSFAHWLEAWSHWSGPAPVGQWVCEILALGMTLGFSFYILFAWRGVRPKRALALSVSIDGIAAFFPFAASALWPAPGFAGLLNLPDLMLLAIMTAATLLRLSVRLVALGATVNLLVLVAVVAIDTGSNGPDVWVPERLTFQLVLHAAAVILALIVVVRTRQVASSAALNAQRAEHAEDNIDVMMKEHHELRSILSAATVRVEALQKTASDDGDQGERLGVLVHALNDDLMAAKELAISIRPRPEEVLHAFHRPMVIDLSVVAARTVDQLRGRFPELAIELVDTSDRAAAWVAGGAEGLERIMCNLVANAWEGNGTRGATHAVLQVRRHPEVVELRLSDDGPGLPAEALQRSPQPGETTKPSHTGMGLSLVAAAMNASSGELRLDNGESGGALICLRFPAAGETDRRDRAAVPD